LFSEREGEIKYSRRDGSENPGKTKREFIVWREEVHRLLEDCQFSYLRPSDNARSRDDHIQNTKSDNSSIIFFFL
jgi:hypothetical protein